jgi:adenylate cyclase class 2
MLEVEMKFPVAVLSGLLQRLAGLTPPAVLIGREREADHYLNAPDRDFARTDEALRIRQQGETYVITYKGPKLDRTTKTRLEIEVPLGPGAATIAEAIALFQALGYRPTATICKTRTTYEVQLPAFRATVCLDEVEGVGTFVELEILAPEEQLAEAHTALHELAKQLGLSDSERRSYLELWLAKHA